MRLGGVLRRHSLDELPQLFNVLRGDMSLVVLRPERAFFVHAFSHKLPSYAERLEVMPGLTGWWSSTVFLAVSSLEAARVRPVLHPTLVDSVQSAHSCRKLHSRS